MIIDLRNEKKSEQLNVVYNEITEEVNAAVESLRNSKAERGNNS